LSHANLDNQILIFKHFIPIMNYILFMKETNKKDCFYFKLIIQLMSDIKFRFRTHFSVCTVIDVLLSHLKYNSPILLYPKYDYLYKQQMRLTKKKLSLCKDKFRCTSRSKEHLMSPHRDKFKQFQKE
jgi:hypothetical protein